MASLGKTKLWGRSYTTVPTTARKILDIKNGDEIEWIFIDNKIIIKKAKKKDNDVV